MIATAPTPVASRGRPRVTSIPTERRKHVEAAVLRDSLGKSYKYIQRRYAVSLATAKRFVRLGRGYDPAERAATAAVLEAVLGQVLMSA